MRGQLANANRCCSVGLMLLSVLLGWLGIASASSASPPVVYDFVEKFPAAEVYTDTRLIEFSSPEATDLLLDGWGKAKGGHPQATRWGIGDESSLRFFVSEPSDLTIR